jgi:hypothetical protein
VHYVDGFVDDVRIVLLGEVMEVFAADVGPEGDEGEVVFDYWSGCHCAVSLWWAVQVGCGDSRDCVGSNQNEKKYSGKLEMTWINTPLARETKIIEFNTFLFNMNRRYILRPTVDLSISPLG